MHYQQVFQKVNEKVNLGRPNAHGSWHHYFKGQIYDLSKFNFGCKSFRLQVPNKESQRCLSYTGPAMIITLKL